ncbi:unnamed protein product [Protopolystoma xenopodis]|uniref:Uncharacterized protein n=1 Tax=Protopolystoma xenopodis TaxID=117903 RepID=A0A3S5ADF4_9PLAT|nr:unnamed protein product [Protopolystoma xenopodis]
MATATLLAALASAHPSCPLETARRSLVRLRSKEGNGSWHIFPAALSTRAETLEMYLFGFGKRLTPVSRGDDLFRRGHKSLDSLICSVFRGRSFQGHRHES